MAKNKIRACWLLLMTAIFATSTLLGTGQAQARYQNTVTWNTVMDDSVEFDQVTSDCLENVNKPAVTVLLGELTGERCEARFTLKSGVPVIGKLNWAVEQYEYVQAQMFLNGVELQTGMDLEIPGDNTGITLTLVLTPTTKALTENRGAVNVYIQVTWGETLRGTFMTYLSPRNYDDSIILTPDDPEEGDGTGDNTGDGTGDNTGGGTGDNTGGETGDNTGDGTGDNTGGETEDNTGGETGDSTGGGTEDNTGGNPDADPAQEQPSEPAVITEPEESQPEESQPSAEDESETQTQDRFGACAVSPEAGQYASGIRFGEKGTQTYREETPESADPPQESGENGETPPTPQTEDTEPPSGGGNTADDESGTDDQNPAGDGETTGDENGTGDENPDGDADNTGDQVPEPIPEPQVKISATQTFKQNNVLWVNLEHQGQMSALELGMGLQNKSGSQDEMETIPFPARLRYSLNGGESFYMLYNPSVIPLVPGTNGKIEVLLDFSRVNLTGKEVKLGAAGFADEAMVAADIASSVAQQQYAVTLSSRILDTSEPLTVSIPQAWQGYTLEYTVEMLTSPLMPDGSYGLPTYEAVELTEEGLFVDETQAGKLEVRLGETLPPAGTYRIRMNWTFAEEPVEDTQVIFYINYTTNKETMMTGGAEQ